MTRYYLNKAILHHDYNLKYYELPENEGLIPAVPSRRHYIQWICDLFIKHEGLIVTKAEPESISKHTTSKVLHGVDIGVGASVIYPLIGVKEYGWKFLGSDISSESLEIAKTIIDKNELSDNIKVILQPNPKRIFDGILESEAHYDF